MSRLKRILTTPLAAGISGGLVVGLLGMLAISAGLIETDGGDTSTITSASTAAPPLSRPAAAGEELSAGDIYDQAQPAIAFISAERSSSPSELGLTPGNGGTATGSGFLIDDQGTILTNAHVVEKADAVTVKLGEDGEELEAKVLGADPSSDVAVLQVDPAKVSAAPLRLADSDAAAVGDPVVAIGNPFGLDLTVTTGIVSALQRDISAPDGFTISHVIQTDAAINPGNSGGPLLNGAGEVIAINSQIATAGGQGSVGVGFSIPANTAADVADQILGGDQVQHAFLGISGGPLTPEVADLLNLDVDSGVLISDVTPDGPADKAGLEAGDATVNVGGAELRVGGDIITSVDGKPIADMEELAALVNDRDPGDELELGVAGKDGDRNVTVTLTDRPEQAQG